MTRRHPSLWALLGGALVAACGQGASTRTVASHVRTTTGVAYYHATVAAGPSLITRDDGAVLDERRAEPFGAPIDGSFELDPHNALNKETDVATGWSDHGARWLAPETARWLTPDPPVKAPDPSFMERPWALHPYQYVEQNPIAYWDPDGNDLKWTVKIGEKSAFKHETDHTKTQFGTIKSSVKDGKLSAEVTAMKYTVKAGGEVGGVPVSAEAEATAFSARASVGLTGAKAEFVVFEVKAVAKVSDTKVQVSYGMALGAEWKFGADEIVFGWKGPVGFRIETTPKDLVSVGLRLGRPVLSTSTIQEVVKQGELKRALRDAPNFSDQLPAPPNPLTSAGQAAQPRDPLEAARCEAPRHP